MNVQAFVFLHESSFIFGLVNYKNRLFYITISAKLDSASILIGFLRLLSSDEVPILVFVQFKGLVCN